MVNTPPHSCASNARHALSTLALAMPSLHPRYRNFNNGRATQQSQTSLPCTRMSGCGCTRCRLDHHGAAAGPAAPSAPPKRTTRGLSSSHVDRLRSLRTKQRMILETPTPACSASDASPSTVSTDEKSAVAQQMLLFLEGQPAQPRPPARPAPPRAIGELRPRRLDLPPPPQPPPERERATELEAVKRLLKDTQVQVHEQLEKTAAAEAAAARADLAAEAATIRADEAVAAVRLEASSAEARSAEHIARLTRRVHELEKALAAQQHRQYEQITPFSPSCELGRERTPSFTCRRTLEYSRSFVPPAPGHLAADMARAGSAESAA